mmetsp:Transcript_53754/g.154328  ORF Transcript_53754/g.154328 Transcript_53754/m.154328 type:complete len:243 (+) Transcript_53754:1452-2180(+)
MQSLGLGVLVLPSSSEKSLSLACQLDGSLQVRPGIVLGALRDQGVDLSEQGDALQLCILQLREDGSRLPGGLDGLIPLLAAEAVGRQLGDRQKNCGLAAPVVGSSEGLELLRGQVQRFLQGLLRLRLGHGAEHQPHGVRLRVSVPDLPEEGEGLPGLGEGRTGVLGLVKAAFARREEHGGFPLLRALRAISSEGAIFGGQVVPSLLDRGTSTAGGPTGWRGEHGSAMRRSPPIWGLPVLERT